MLIFNSTRRTRPVRQIADIRKRESTAEETMIKRKLAVLVLASTCAGMAQSVTQEGEGSKQNAFAVGASVGDACIMTQPQDVQVAPILYWTSNNTATGSTSVNIRCNTGARYRLSVSQPATLSKSGDLPLLVGVTPLLRRQGTAGQLGDTANTVLGRSFDFNVTVTRPTRFQRAGQYSGNATVTLNVLAP